MPSTNRNGITGRCIEIRRVGYCAHGVDFTRTPSAARWVYATSHTLIVPSVSRRTVKGNSSVVVIGVGRHRVGRENGNHRAPERGVFSQGRNEGLGAVYAGARLAHRTCYYTDQLPPRERRNEELVKKLRSGLMAARIPGKH